MQATPPPTQPHLIRVSTELREFPLPFFAVVMGLAGLTLAWEKASVVAGQALWIDQATLLVAPLIFIILTLFYLGKWLYYPAEARSDLSHPTKLAFLPLISVDLLLISLSLLNLMLHLAQWIWIIGTSLHLVFSLLVINSWLHLNHYQIQTVSPAWFILVIGNILVPLVGIPLGFAQTSWFYFSIGMLLWGILFTIALYRVLFHTPSPTRLIPTLFILIAPPAIGFLAYLKMTEILDSFAFFLYYIALFLTILLFTQLHLLVRVQLFLSWWAYSFSLATITIATLTMYEKTHLFFFLWLGIFLLLALSLVIFILLMNTVRAILNNAIYIED